MAAGMARARLRKDRKMAATAHARTTLNSGRESSLICWKVTVLVIFSCRMSKSTYSVVATCVLGTKVERIIVTSSVSSSM